MTHTVLSSATKEVAIGFDRPFVMIGERINPTGRKLLAEEMKARRLQPGRGRRHRPGRGRCSHARTSTPASRWPTSRPCWLGPITLVQGVVDVPLSIDSSIIDALEAGLAVYQGKPLVNSVTGEEEVMERVLPLVAKHGAAVVAISNDETGISEDPDVRFEIAKRIVNRAADHGIPASDIVGRPAGDAHRRHGHRRPAGVPPRPPAAGRAVGQHDLRCVERQLRAARAGTTSPARFLAMAIGAGMTSAIMNPMHPEVKQMVMAADVLAGNDENCAAWIRVNRDPGADGDAAPTGRRRGGRSARREEPTS